MKKLKILTCKRWLLRIATLIAVTVLLTSCKEQIIHDLEESDANRFVTRLHEASIVSDKVKQANGQWAIAVSKSDTISAIKTLSDARMFKNYQGQAHQKASLVSSKEDQRFSYERAVSRELERTLTGMPDVLEARVHLNLPASDPIFGSRIPDSKGSGSVLLVVADSFASNIAQIKELVSGASGIDKAYISVLVSREKQAAAAENIALVKQAALPPPTEEKSTFSFEHRQIYLVASVFLIFAGLYLALRRVSSKREAARRENEDDLYELARNIN